MVPLARLLATVRAARMLDVIAVGDREREFL
jgi:hypothetical protein